jgi:hypothetical protein
MELNNNNTACYLLQISSGTYSPSGQYVQFLTVMFNDDLENQIFYIKEPVIFTVLNLIICKY